MSIQRTCVHVAVGSCIHRNNRWNSRTWSMFAFFSSPQHQYIHEIRHTKFTGFGLQAALALPLVFLIVRNLLLHNGEVLALSNEAFDLVTTPSAGNKLSGSGCEEIGGTLASWSVRTCGPCCTARACGASTGRVNIGGGGDRDDNGVALRGPGCISDEEDTE